MSVAFAQRDAGREDIDNDKRRESRRGGCIDIGIFRRLRYQPGRRSKSWQFTIRTQRKEVAYVLSEAPSLRGKFGDEAWLDIVWSKARSIASNETGLDLDAFPEVLPWQVDDVLSSEFYAE